MAAEITRLAGSSRYFLGSVVSYHRDVKNKLLDVPMTLIESVGEVSVEVAMQMARGVRHATGSNWAVGISGIAGPGGGSEEKPVGLVCFAVAGPDYEWSGAVRFGSNLSRAQIQDKSVEFAADAVLKALNGQVPDALQ